MSDTEHAGTDSAFERAYLAAEDEARTPAELAAVAALEKYRQAREAGESIDVDELIRAAPAAAREIRAAIEAYDFISEAGSQVGLRRAAWSPESFPTIPGYEVLRVLGQGGMGVVYEAVQQSLQRPVAIKVLAPHLERQADVIARFNREIQLMTRLTHPNIVDIIDAGVIDGRHYYVMEYVAGLSLERILRKHRVRPHTAVAILKQIVTGLMAAHKQGILHRDLKPGNILLDRNAVVRIADFGLAGVAPERRESEGAVTQAVGRLGTIGYMSPEQLRDPTQCDARSDLYSVGVIFYQMLTGQLPQGKFPPATSLVPGLTSAADQLIDKCLRTDPDERYASAELLLHTVGKLERRITRTRRKLLRMARERRDDGVSIELQTAAAADMASDLATVIDAWPRLPEALRAGIIAIVRSAERDAP